MVDGTDRALWNRARRGLFAPVSVVFALLAALCAVGLRIPEPLQYIPFALSLIVLGLPHGALDHVVLSRLARRAPDARAIAFVSLLYLVVGAVVVLLWFAAPAIAFVLFILMTWFHWGQGDLHVEATRVGAGSPSRVTRAGMLLVRGALPMVVPLVAFPEAYLGVFRNTTGVIAVSMVDVSPLFDSTTRMLIAAALGLLIVVTFIGTARARWPSAAGRRAWWGDLGEVMLLAAFFAVVPPILAVGLYFCLWHSLRHIVRLSLLDPEWRSAGARASGTSGGTASAIRRFAVRSAPITAIALVLLVALFFVVPQAGVTSGALLGLYLVLISALTFPHVIIVSIMDARQEVWARGPKEQLVGAGSAAAVLDTREGGRAR